MTTSKENNARISKLARINERIGNLHFEAVKDNENEEWLVRIGIIRVVDCIDEIEAKSICESLNTSLASGVGNIIFANSSEIKKIIELSSQNS